MTQRDQATEGPRDRGLDVVIHPPVPESLDPSVPLFFDLQVNGYAGADFNCDDLAPEALNHACEQLVADGVGQILATVITDDLDRMCGRLRRLAQLRERDPLARQVIAGLHIEGPFLNESAGYIGAHPSQHARPADADAMHRLLDAGGGLTRLVTLAPERDDGMKVTRMLAERGIIVAAGHGNASLDQLLAAIDAGLSMFTHLGNGCPLELPRHDNIIQRVLSLADRLWISFIADGAHVPLFALGNYLRLVPAQRIVIVSDAISAAGLGPGRYSLGNQQVMIGDDLVPRSPAGYLMGSACPVKRMVENLRTMGFGDDDVRAWTSQNPAKILGIADRPLGTYRT